MLHDVVLSFVETFRMVYTSNRGHSYTLTLVLEHDPIPGDMPVLSGDELNPWRCGNSIFNKFCTAKLQLIILGTVIVIDRRSDCLAPNPKNIELQSHGI